MNKMDKFSLSLHLFISIGALFGGLMAILNPAAPLGLSSQDLPAMPFPDFFIPGLILFLVIGLGNLAGALIYLRFRSLAPYGTGICGGALIIWIIVQCFMLQAIAALHVIFFSLGAWQGLRALFVLYRQRRFPFHWLARSS